MRVVRYAPTCCWPICGRTAPGATRCSRRSRNCAARSEIAGWSQRPARAYTLVIDPGAVDATRATRLTNSAAAALRAAEPAHALRGRARRPGAVPRRAPRDRSAPGRFRTKPGSRKCGSASPRPPGAPGWTSEPEPEIGTELGVTRRAVPAARTIVGGPGHRPLPSRTPGATRSLRTREYALCSSTNSASSPGPHCRTSSSKSYIMRHNSTPERRPDDDAGQPTTRAGGPRRSRRRPRPDPSRGTGHPAAHRSSARPGWARPAWLSNSPDR